MFPSLKALPWERRTPRRIAACSSARRRNRAKRSSFTARAAGSGRRQCNWRALAVCACSALPDHLEQVMNATSGRGVDVIVELLANVNLAKDLTILARNRRVAVIGNRGRVEIDPRDAMQRDADIRGMALPNTPPEELASIHAALVAGLENGTLPPVIGKEFKLAEAPQAHRAVIESGALGKIVLIS